jgi:lactam utilization protein B
MPLYDVDITEHIERRVTVEARSQQQAKRLACAKSEWLDASTGTTVAVEVDDVTAHEADVTEVDCMEVVKFDMENREQ